MFKRLALLFALILIVLNVLAYHHARSFFVYTDGGERTPSPESLGALDKLRVLVSGIRVPKPKAHATPADFGISYESISVPGRAGVMLSAWRLPNTPRSPLVIVHHGYNSEKSGLLPEASRFHAMGYEVIMVDFAGHGDSPGNEVSLGIREAGDVAAVFAWARAQYPERPIIVYGHSMGGAAILRAMATVDVRPDAAVVESVFDTLLNAIRFRFALLGVPSFPAAEVLLFWGNQQLGVDGFSHDLVAYASEIDAPVLVSHGTSDNRASVAGARKVHDALRGDKQMLIIEGAGHVNPCLTGSEQWIEAVSNFVWSASVARP